MEPETAETESLERSKQPDSADKPEAVGNVDRWWLSDSSDGEDGSLDQQQQPQNNDDILYDPDADDEDERWVQEQRKGHLTDAILSCPGCFTTLCIDCQQHSQYHTQYRAMITMNCEVKPQPMWSQVQRQPQQQQQQGKKRQVPDGYEDTLPQQQQHKQQQQQHKEEEVLYPVCCAVCGTQVGAQDVDEVVHFFHVLASEC